MQFQSLSRIETRDVQATEVAALLSLRMARHYS